jgi:transcriptional regulator with XRE-family HTH domain
LYKEGRKKAGMTIDEAAFQLHVSSRMLAKYEAGQCVPAPEVVLGMSRVYRESWMTQRYCKNHCAIGQAYSYEILNAVSLDPVSVVVSLRQEFQEAMEDLDKLLNLVLNKRPGSLLESKEAAIFDHCRHELLDVAHCIVSFQHSTSGWGDLAVAVQQHNQKCRDKGYVIAGKG